MLSQPGTSFAPVLTVSVDGNNTINGYKDQHGAKSWFSKRIYEYHLISISSKWCKIDWYPLINIHEYYIYIRSLWSSEITMIQRLYPVNEPLANNNHLFFWIGGSSDDHINIRWYEINGQLFAKATYLITNDGHLFELGCQIDSSLHHELWTTYWCCIITLFRNIWLYGLTMYH